MNGSFTALKVPLALCASRINTRTRLMRLEQMLTSWTNQTRPCKLVLIINALNDKLELLTDKMLATVQLRVGDRLVILRASGTQFQKYAAALPVITQLTGGDENAWLMFSDDDDLWHPKRVETLLTFVAEQDAPAIVEICTDWMCADYNSKYDTRSYNTADEVSEEFKRGRLTVSGLEASGLKASEYVQSLVRAHCLRGYVTQSSPALIAHAYADLGFISYIRVPGRHKTLFIRKNAFSQITWLYFYRREESCLTLSASVYKDEGMVDKLTARVGALSPTQRLVVNSALDYTEMAIIQGQHHPRAGKWEELWLQWECLTMVLQGASYSEVMQARGYRSQLQSIIEAEYMSLYPVSHVGCAV